jgi:hypothetical protein
MPTRTYGLVLGLLAACGDLEKDRICIGHVCPEWGQSKECAAYVACYEKTGGTPGSLDSTYGKQGTCWTTSPAASQSCTAACKTAVASLQAAFPEAKCASP